MMSIPRPKMSAHDKRLNFTALATGFDNTSFPPLQQSAVEQLGMDMTPYYQRSWGDHPDLHSLDGSSITSAQSSNFGLGSGSASGRKGGSNKGDSRFDPRYETASHGEVL
jgi:hypothetical protein